MSLVDMYFALFKKKKRSFVLLISSIFSFTHSSVLPTHPLSF
ncbi:10318_t:CDS:2 [Gigaspora margarita]|uniref:10318_t:CDS:1 n=1 Tax=Gigaspora margarita TaxID=4874 RepID=A0ABN7ULV2_GIGMA|nr:10318_t:CDS:2 [Gigaspora margarita]